MATLSSFLRGLFLLPPSLLHPFLPVMERTEFVAPLYDRSLSETASDGSDRSAWRDRLRRSWTRSRRRPKRGNLQALDRWTDSAVAALDDAIVGCSEAGIISHWSPSAEAMFGYAARDAIGNPLNMLAAPDRTNVLRDLLARVRRGNAVRRDEAQLRHRDGRQLSVMLTATPVCDRERQALGAAFLIRDVTALRRVADELADTQARLAVLQNQMLHLSRLTAMEQTAVTLAHELNQPLAAIVNYVRAGQRLLADRTSPDLRRLGAVLDGSMAQSLRAGQIVGRLRAFVARGETEKRVEVLASLIEEAVSLAGPDIGPRAIRPSLTLDPSARLVLVDRVQVQQVLMNLIRNAAEAMQDCERRDLAIASRWSNGVVEISVADTGPGIPAAVRDRLFEPFVTTRRHGTGLGLMICRAIVEAHGGKLSWQPAPDGGTVFGFTVTGIAEADT